MQYLLLLTYRPARAPQEGTPEFDAEMQAGATLIDELRAAGRIIGASGLAARRGHHRPRAATAT